jgi:glycosyltransferase involved in cell wall biosynthesis
MQSAAVFLCPIQSGSGVRVKLLEAFAYGIPVVSTVIGAEGLAAKDGEFCRLADHPVAFADSIEQLLKDRNAAAAMGHRAHDYVSQHWDASVVIARLAQQYTERLRAKLASASCR